MSQFVVRRVTSSDKSAARQIRLESLRESPEAFDSLYADAFVRSDEWWDSWMSAGTIYLAGDENGDVGISRVQATDEFPDEVAMLYSMWVAPRARRLGVGEMLVHECVNWARNAGFAEIRLAVVAHNHHAVGLYRRCGFHPTGHTETRERDGATIAEMSRSTSSERTLTE